MEEDITDTQIGNLEEENDTVNNDDAAAEVGAGSTFLSANLWVQLTPDELTLTKSGDSIMNDIMWPEIPDDIMMRVLSFLPLRRLFQMRVVCKRWSNLTQCPDFNKICLEVKAPVLAPHPAVCYVYNRLGFRWAVFDTAEGKWQVMPNFHARFEDERTKNREIYVASRGLLCLLEVGTIDVMKSLTIWNPLTNHEQQLPKFLSLWSFPLVRIMVHYDNTNSYKLILSGNQNYPPQDERYSATEIFDSAKGVWVQGGKLLPNLMFPFSNGAVCNGAVYYFASRPMTMYDILLKYDVDEDKWSEIDHIIPQNTYCTPYLFDYNGNLLTLMHLLSGPPARNASCAIFHLDFNTREWTILTHLPELVYMDFAYIGGCLASGKQLCVTGNASNRNLIVAVYDDGEHNWNWLPTCPLVPSADLIERHTTFTFHPTFHNPRFVLEQISG